MALVWPAHNATPWDDTLKTYVDQSFIRPSGSGDAFGHSYLSSGASDPSYLFWQRFATQLGGASVSYGRFGARLIDDLSVTRGGYAAILQMITPTGNGGKSASTQISPSPGPIVALWGYNDCLDSTTGTGANTAAINTAYLYAFRTVVSFAQAGWRTDIFDSSVTTFTGTWSNTTSQNVNVNNAYKQTSTTNDTVTITLPSGFKGGVVALRMICNKSGGTIPASTVNCKVDGSNATPIGFGSANVSTQLASTVTPVQVPFRFSLSAGAHTIVLTAGAGGMAFDGMHIEANPPRPVLWANIAQTPAMTGTQITAMNTFNATISSAVSEFGSSVVQIVDINSALNNTAANFIADNVHPNDLGHALIAGAFTDAWRAFPFSTFGGGTAASGRMVPPYLQNYRALSWYAPTGTRSTLTPAANGDFYYTAFTVEQSHTFNGIGIQVTGAAAPAGAIARLGIYAEDTNGGPGNLITDLGSVAVDTTGVKTITSLTIGPLVGRFWLGCNIQGATTTRPTLVSVTEPQGNTGLVNSTDFTATGTGGWKDSRSITAGTLPILSIPTTIGPAPLVAMQG